VDVSLLARRILDDLVAAPSENPPGDERAAAAVATEHLVRAGFNTRQVYRDARRPNVLGTLRRGPGRRLILQGHLDTKPARFAGTADRWTVDPFAVTEQDGRLYGLGTCDTKGGLAGFLAAATVLAADPDWTGELVVQAVADEEDGSWYGAQLLLERDELGADAAVVAEPTGCHPSHAQLGNAWAEVRLAGVAAHAGRPELGEDAVAAAIRYVGELRRLVAETPDDPLFPGHPRVNVGEVSAPGHPGTLAAECRLRCDIRVLPGQLRDDVLALYERAASALRTATLQIAVEPYQGGGCQSHYVDPATPIVAELRAAARQAVRQVARQVDPGPAAGAFFGGTDARFFAMAGTPAVVFGPGSLDQAHAPDEYVEAGQLADAAQILVTACGNYLKANPAQSTSRC
jgi:acetylornithine deacetylase/succinyl-diaminopimelate desuccinylase-like protein